VIKISILFFCAADDPLSALDPEVGKRLFDECIVELMAGKTRLFVTNQIQFLQKCDRVVALGQRRVLEQGSFVELTERDDSEVKRILDDDKASRQHESASSSSTKDKTAEITEAKVEPPVDRETKEKTALISKEERNVGAVEFQVYKKYIRSGGGLLKFLFVLFAFLLCALIQLANTAWVSFWTSDADYSRFSAGFYLGLYATIAVALGLFTYIRTFMLVRFGVDASARLHQSLLFSILAAPQSFFDTTPVGRILSRFSKDFYSIDIEVSENLSFFLSMVLSVIFSLASILFVTPWFGVAILPLGYFYITILNYFRNVSRETKRLESLSRSPVYAHFSETLGGLTTIRAYGEGTRFQREFDKKSDENIRAYYCIKTADRWLSVRLEAIGATIAGLAAIFACNVVIASSEVSGKSSESAFASLAGLSISFAISITGMLNWW
jgi:ATP-binding cassette, subfamily C (CFTR/MRP), member 1